MPINLKRRDFVMGALAGLASPAGAQDLPATLRPRSRPVLLEKATANDLVTLANLGGASGFVVADALTGAIVESFNANMPLPPASVAKTITALYSLEKLGANHRFATRLLATGPMVNGRIQGDLILAGGGDPTLDTDVLGDMAALLRKGGVRSIGGRYLVWAGSLPEILRISDEQPIHVGYNPGLSGLILNFGRVYFEWWRNGDGWATSMDARGERYAPPIALTRMDVVSRANPLFTYQLGKTIEDWTVAQGALGKDGSRWLPVRRAAPYVAEAFRMLAVAHGIDLAPADMLITLPTDTRELVRHESSALPDLLRGMLRWSTNITAEAVGLAATGAGTLRGSALVMTEWSRRHLGHPGDFVDHSGLGSGSRVTPAGMVRALVASRGLHRGRILRDILRAIPLHDNEGDTVSQHKVRVVAKTGTLNFASGLAGFIQPANGRELAFAIFSADPARRAGLAMDDREDPPGGKVWLKRARDMQIKMLRLWSNMAG